MNIAFITESFPELSETFILGKAVELKRRGHRVTVFTQARGASTVHPDLLAGIDLRREVFRLPVWDRVRVKDLGRGFQAAGYRAGAVVKSARAALGSPRGGRLLTLSKSLPFCRGRFDLIHAHYAYMGLRYLDVARALDAPLVVSLLGTDASIDIPDDPKPYQALFGQAARMIAVVDYLKQKVVEHGCAASKVVVIPTEADTDFFGFEDRRGRSPGPVSVLTVGRLDWTKGHLYALEAMARLKARGVPFRYRIVGGGRDRNAVRLAVKDYGLEDRVELLGPLDREGVRRAMGQADIFVLASVIEGIGGVLLEAQATGLPVIATRVGGLPEVVKEGETGFLVPSRNPEALAERIEDLIARPEERLAMGIRAREFCVSNFNRDLLMDRLEEVYRQVVLEWKGRGPGGAGHGR